MIKMKLKFSLFLLPVLLTGCVTTSVTLKEASPSTHDAKVVELSSRSSCKIEEAGERVVIHVVIDAKAENMPFLRANQRKKIEASAMLRTWQCLRKTYPEIGKSKISSRRLKNSFDDDIGCYFYSTSFKFSDIQKAQKATRR